MRLDGTITWSYADILFMAIFMILVNAILVLIDLKERKTKEILKSLGILGWITVCIILFMINLMGKGVLISWNIVFLPLYIGVVYYFIYGISDTFLASREGEKNE